MGLTGKVAIVTGGGTGIGEAVTRRFVAEGAKVCIAGRRKGVLEDLAKALPPGAVKPCAADVTDPKDVVRLVETALSFALGLHVVVNNAGVDQEPPGSVVDIAPEVWRQVLEANLTGPFMVMKATIPHIIKAGGGSIINISSLAGLRSIPYNPAYCASKGGLISLSQQAALDYGRDRVRCNVVCPGAVKTEMFSGAMEHFAESLGLGLEEVLRRFTNDSPLRRVAEPQEIGGLCSYLAGDDSRFLTGAVIPIDGGAAIVDVQGAAISRLVAGGHAK